MKKLMLLCQLFQYSLLHKKCSEKRWIISKGTEIIILQINKSANLIALIVNQNMNNMQKVRVLVDSYVADLEIEMIIGIEELISFIRNEGLLSDFCIDEDLQLFSYGKKLSLQEKVEDLQRKNGRCQIEIKQPKFIQEFKSPSLLKSMKKKRSQKDSQKEDNKEIQKIEEGLEAIEDFPFPSNEKLEMPQKVYEKMERINKKINSLQSKLFSEVNFSQAIIKILYNHYGNPTVIKQKLSEVFYKKQRQTPAQKQALSEEFERICSKIEEIDNLSTINFSICDQKKLKISKSKLISEVYEEKTEKLNLLQDLIIKNIQNKFQKPIKLKSIYCDQGQNLSNPLINIKKLSNMLALFRGDNFFIGIVSMEIGGFLFDVQKEKIYKTEKKKIWKSSLFDFSVGDCFYLIPRKNNKAAVLKDKKIPLSNNFEIKPITLKQLINSDTQQTEVKQYELITFDAIQ